MNNEIDKIHKDVYNELAGNEFNDGAENEIAIISEENLADKIYFIRGQKVMLDFELAEIYGYSTKAFNQQVKNI